MLEQFHSLPFLPGIYIELPRWHEYSRSNFFVIFPTHEFCRHPLSNFRHFLPDFLVFFKKIIFSSFLFPSFLVLLFLRTIFYYKSSTSNCTNIFARCSLCKHPRSGPGGFRAASLPTIRGRVCTYFDCSSFIIPLLFLFTKLAPTTFLVTGISIWAPFTGIQWFFPKFPFQYVIAIFKFMKILLVYGIRPWTSEKNRRGCARANVLF